jgi:hypothetical protein
MLTHSEHPETLDEVQQSIQRWFGESSEGVSPFTFSRGNGSADILCLMSHSWGDLKVSTAREWVLLEMKHSRLRLNLDKFLVTTAVDGARVCLNIEPEPESEHRVLSWVLQDIAETKHPAFQSRILRAFLNLEEDLPNSTIEEATGAPTDFLVALEALSSAPGTAQLIADDPLLAAKIRGLKRKRQMLVKSRRFLASQDKRSTSDVPPTSYSHSHKAGAGTAIRASSLTTAGRFAVSSRFSGNCRLSIHGCRWPSSPPPMKDSEAALQLRDCKRG